MEEKIKFLFYYLTNIKNYDITIEDIDEVNAYKFIVNGDYFDIYTKEEFEEIFDERVDNEYNYYEECLLANDELASAYNHGLIIISRENIEDEYSYMDDRDLLGIPSKVYDWVDYEGTRYLINEE